MYFVQNGIVQFVFIIHEDFLSERLSTRVWRHESGSAPFPAHTRSPGQFLRNSFPRRNAASGPRGAAAQSTRAPDAILRYPSLLRAIREVPPNPPPSMAARQCAVFDTRDKPDRGRCGRPTDETFRHPANQVGRDKWPARFPEPRLPLVRVLIPSFSWHNEARSARVTPTALETPPRRRFGSEAPAFVH